MAKEVVLAIDLVLGALIGPPGCLSEQFLEQCEHGEYAPFVTDLALFCAMSSVRAGDTIDHARFARLLRVTHPMASGGRADDGGFSPPSIEEIEHWRDVVFGRDRDDDAANVSPS